MTSRPERGFTLVELLVVLALAGMALALAVPLIARHATGPSLDAATAQIRAGLRGARSTAMTEGRAVVFQGDPGSGYWLDRRHVELPEMSGGAALRVATAGGARISFYPSGGSSGGRIVVSSGEGHREIAIDSITGRADARR
jgi:general secretion pathway protein H